MSQTAFNLNDSIEYSKHILYEWQMLRYNYKQLYQLKNGTIEEVVSETPSKMGTFITISETFSPSKTSERTTSEIGISTTIPTTFENTILESFLIHARNLICFLDLEGTKDDIPAKRLLPSWNLSNKSDDTRERINKYLAHLTATRLNKTKWDWGQIYEYIRERLALFAKQLDTKLLYTDFIAIFLSEGNE